MDPTCTFHVTGNTSLKTKEALANIIKKSTSSPFEIILPDQLRPILNPGALVRFEKQKDAMSFLSNFKKRRDLQIAPCTQVYQRFFAKLSPWLYSLFDTVRRYAEQLDAQFFDAHMPSLTGAVQIFPILEEQIFWFLNAKYSTARSDVQAKDVSLDNVVWIRDIPLSATKEELLRLLRRHCRGLENVYLRECEAIAVFKSEEGARVLLKTKLEWFSTRRRLKVQPCSRQIFTIWQAIGAKWLAADYVRVRDLARCTAVRECRENRVITFTGDDNELKNLEIFLRQEYIDDTENAGSNLNSQLKGKERDRLTFDDRAGEMDSATGVDQTNKSHDSSSETLEQLHEKPTQSTNKSLKDEVIVESMRSSRSRGAPGDVRMVDDKGLEIKLSEEKKRLNANNLPDTTSEKRYNNREVSVWREDRHGVDHESEGGIGQSTSPTFSLEGSKNFSDVKNSVNDILSTSTKPEPGIPNKITDNSTTIESKHLDVTTALHKIQSSEENDSQAGKLFAHNGHDFPNSTLSKQSVEHTYSLTEEVNEEIPMDEDIVTFMFKVKRKEIEEIEKSYSVIISSDVTPYEIKRRTDSTHFDGPSKASNDIKSMYNIIRDSVHTDKLSVGDLKVTIVSLRRILERVNEEQSRVYVKNNLNNFEIVVYGEKKQHIAPAMKKLNTYIRDEEENHETPEESQKTNPVPQWLTSSYREPSSSLQHDPLTLERLSISSRSNAFNRKGQATDESTTRSNGKKSFRRTQSLDEELQLHLEMRQYSFTTNEGLRVVVKYGDITQEVVDIVVNAANETLEHAGGVAKALVRAGGREIQRESRDLVKKYGPLDVSGVAMTGSGKLTAQYILHAYGPIWDYHGTASERLLRKTIERVLQKADDIKAKSVAIPAISSGVHGMPKDTCARAMYDALIKFSSKIDRTGHLKEIVFVNIEPDTVRAFIVEFFSRNMAGAYGNLSALQGQVSQAILPLGHASVTPKTDQRYRSQGTAQHLSTDVDTLWNSSKTSQPTSTRHLSLQLKKHQVSSTSSLFPSLSSSYTFAKPSDIGSHSPSGHNGVTSHGSILHTTGAGLSTPKIGAMSNIDSISQDGGIGDCTICADDNVKLKKLLCCSYLICETCAGKHFASNSKCPSCQKAVVLVDGNQPRSGKMEYQSESSSLPGYSSYGTIVIEYYFPDGMQEAEHPNPGKPYTGTLRRAYLPSNTEGRAILDLLEKAFNRRLLFTIGTSHTTGQTDCVVWNDVHHKTSRTGGPTCYGYPDSGYLRRVKDELAAKGIK